MQLNSQIDIKIIIFCIAVLGYFILQGFKLYNKFSKKKFYIWATLRILTLSFLMLSLLHFNMVLTNKDITTMFLIDRSLSAEESKKEIEAYINKQLENKKGNEEVGVITFGKEPMMETPLSKETEKIKIQTRVDDEFTNIEKALSFATDYFPGNTNKRLIIFTDGKENVGDVSNIVEKLKQEKMNVIFYPLKEKKTKDVQLTTLSIPQNVHKGEIVPLTAKIHANFKTTGKLYLFDGNKKIIEKILQVDKGENTFKFDVNINERMDVRGEIKFEGDENLKNNRFKVTVLGKEEPKALVIGKPEDTKNIDFLLDGLNINRINYLPSTVSEEIAFLSTFNTVFLVNVPYHDLPKDFGKNLDTCVKEQGKGLILIGGEKTFALGGYKGTDIEKILPVTSKMKGNKKQPNTGLVLIIDASGSMEDESGGIKKIEMAKEAAIRSVDILEEEDSIGILAFSDEVEWIVPFKKAQNKEKIKEDIGKLTSKGGTLIKPALEESLKTLETTDTKVRHMILLTDGQGEKQGYGTIIEELKKNQITVSTVAFGKDADQKLLKDISDDTKGRNYFAQNFSSIPKIFARETYLATKKYINNRVFTPKMVSETEFFKADDMSKLNGYMGTGIKKGATCILKSDMDDPILAHWKYGLGNVMVWTSDLNGKWSREYIHFDEFQKQWGNIINYSLSQYNEDDIEIQINQKRTNIELFVDTNSKESEQSIKVGIQGPKNIKKEINLKQVMVGKFKGDISLDQTGDYALSFQIQNKGEIIKNLTRIIHLSYSPEYEIDDSKILEKLVLKVDGDLIDQSADVFEIPIKKKNRTEIPLDFIFMPLTLMLFIGDIWIRKRL